MTEQQEEGEGAEEGGGRERRRRGRGRRRGMELGDTQRLMQYSEQEMMKA